MHRGFEGKLRIVHFLDLIACSRREFSKKKKKKVSNFFRRKYPTVCIQRAKNNSKKKKISIKDSYLSEKMKAVSVNERTKKERMIVLFLYRKKKKNSSPTRRVRLKHYNIET